jgi:hypothetical protein
MTFTEHSILKFVQGFNEFGGVVWPASANYPMARTNPWVDLREADLASHFLEP